MSLGTLSVFAVQRGELVGGNDGPAAVFGGQEVHQLRLVSEILDFARSVVSGRPAADTILSQWLTLAPEIVVGVVNLSW